MLNALRAVRKASRATTPFLGAFLAVGMRWVDRLLGVVGTLVLARLLSPDDFGLVAMATVVAGLPEVLVDLGVGTALIQKDRVDAEDFHTAWTLRLAQSFLAALVVAACAHPAAAYFDDGRVVPVLQFMAVAVGIGGFENIGTVSFQRNMEFGRDFSFYCLRSILTVTVTIAMAAALRSYWALVLGSIASRLAGVGLSYAMSDFRPRLSLSRTAGLWAFSQWSLLTGVGRYLYGAAGRFLIGGRSDAASLGAYTVGEQIAFLPTTELLAPLGRVMFPVFSATRHARGRLLQVVTLAQSVQALIAVPASVGVALVAEDAVPLVLGDQWRGAIPVARVIALAGVVLSLTHSIGYMLMSVGRIRTLCAFTWARLLLLVALLVLIFPRTNLVEVALAYLITSLTTFLALQAIAGRVLPGFGIAGMFRQAWRPLVAATAMSVIVIAVGRVLATQAATLRLAAEIGTGALAYVLAIILLWRVAGLPEGAERYLLARLTGRPAAIDPPVSGT